MNKTKHFNQRTSQRGIPHELAMLTVEIGRMQGDRYVLGRKEVDEELDRLDERRRLLLKARDKGGLVVVADEGAFITAYRCEGGRTH